MTKIHAEGEAGTPDFRLNRRGDGFSLSWKGAATALGAITLAVVAWLSLKEDVHAQGDELRAVREEVRGLAIDMRRQEKLLTALDVKMGLLVPAAPAIRLPALHEGE